MLDTGYWILDTGYWILDTGFFAIRNCVLEKKNRRNNGKFKRI